MVRPVLVLLLCFSLMVSHSQCQDVRHFYTEAKNALREKSYGQFYTMISKAHELHPYNQTILWHVGLAAALTNRPSESIAFLNRAININTSFDLDDGNLSSLKMDSGFKKLLTTKAILNTPVIQSDTAFVISDRQLHLESVAIDPVDSTLYGGSIHKRKIIKIERNGSVSDFTLPEQYPIMGAVFGLKVDATKRILWACSSAVPEMQHYDSIITAALFQFDLNTGRILHAVHPDDTLNGHVFGDLALDSKGVPYVSDSRNNVVYRYDPEHHRLAPYFSSTEFWNIQGLAFSADDRLLYISDYVKGIFVLDTQQLKLSKIKVHFDLSLKGTDGILFFDNSLIAIQNGVHPNRVVRNYFDETGYEFMHYEYIDNAHPAFGEPTIGTIADSTLYYISNSQWNGYVNNKIKDAVELQPVVILKHVFRDVK